MITPITATSLHAPAITHGFFTRQGGVSSGEYATLNVGYGSGDATEQVGENRRRIAAALGSAHADIVTCYQIHSPIVHHVQGFSDTPLEGDALVTRQRGLAIAVLTADCVPVLFADSHTGVIGAAHSGWKGAYVGISERTIDAMIAMGASKDNIIAAIGPSIQQPSYEVGADLKEKFTALDASYAPFFKAGKDAAHVQFDLPGLVEYQLCRLDIAKVEKLDYDTYADAAQFYSFRRSTHENKTSYGRQCSAIMLT